MEKPNQTGGGAEWTSGDYAVGAPVRGQWESGLFDCLGRNDEYCGVDNEVCVLGCFAPCVLSGTNAEQVGRGSFTSHCLPYACLCVPGIILVGCNCFAPFFSFPTRSTIRQQFNLEGTFETLSRSCGCCDSIIEDEAKREQFELLCDFLIHYWIHPCSLCQEGRELRRRVLPPGFTGRVVVMNPPGGQMMDRGSA